ncbi:MAG: poly-beta-1,6 N-acetyl-D-glucosamine synthase [Colwellia sp.]|nr:poly-beta-1,6 N-acetyl-D-glucosamine synthase [Colwellia sp.]
MSLTWICGGIYYYFHWERKQLLIAIKGGPFLTHHPSVSILLPCYNEGENVDETISFLIKQNYPDYEIVAINDGSKDDTGERLDRLARQCSSLIVAHQPNQGKAAALNHALSCARGEILVCIDGDALLDENAVKWMVSHFINSPQVGAVTGNPRVRTRSTIVGKLQTGEFSSIIGLIKRSQQLYGTIFTISGVVCAFRRSAIEYVGNWSTDMVTEDIDITWKLQIAGWQVRYEAQAVCWVLMPETFKGLYKQRLRWAQGGSEVFWKYLLKTLHWSQRKFWPLQIEYLLSVCWCYSMLIVGFNLLLDKTFESNISPDIVEAFIYNRTGLSTVFLCLIQFSISFIIDKNYDSGLLKNFIWCVWYPIFYWILNVVTVIFAFPKGLVRKKGKNAVWESPDRGEAFREKEQ